MTRVWACVRVAVEVAFAGVIVVRLGAGTFLAGRTHRTTPTAHTVVTRRRRRPTTIPAVEGVLDG